MRSYLDWYYRRDYQNAYKIIVPISCFFHSILPFYGSMILRLYRTLSPTKLAIFPLSLYALNNRCSLVRKLTTRTQWTMKTWETSDSWSSLQSFGLTAGGWRVNSVVQHRKPGRTVRATVLERPAARIYPVKRDGSGWFISLPLPGFQSTGRTLEGLA